MLLSNMLAGLPAEIVRDTEVTGFGPLTMTGEGLLHYFADRRFAHQLAALSGARAVLAPRALAEAVPPDFGLALCDDPKEVFLKAYCRHGAQIEASAPFPNQIDPSARIHPRAVIADHSVRIGRNVSIGANAVIHERVTIEDDVAVGANSVIGGDGFELGTIDGRQIVVPHYGSVLVRKGATIHSNCTIDWGLYRGVTEIGEGSALDNLVHIAHNVRIGGNCQLMACVMVAGSTVVGDGVRIGPNATLSNGLAIGRGARVTLGAVVAQDVAEGAHVTGNFAIPHRRFLRNFGASKA